MGHGTGNECANRLWRTTTDQEPQPRDNFHGDNVLESSSKWSGMQADAAHSHDPESRTVRALPGATPVAPPRLLRSPPLRQRSVRRMRRRRQAPPKLRVRRAAHERGPSFRDTRTWTRVIAQAFPPHSLSSH